MSMIRKGNLLKLLVNIIGFSQLAICRRKICSQKWVAMFTRKMPTVLNRMNNQFSDFSDFFLVMVDFVYNFPVCHLNFQVCHRPKMSKQICCRSKEAISTWKMSNMLNRLKNKHSDFCDFKFLVYGRLKLNQFAKKNLSQKIRWAIPD